jgi:glycosyltransferase involved in cell wall biosynthesis
MSMHVAMLAPPWIPVPAPGYGGIEEVVRLLCDGLVARGHRVTLFAPPGSRSPADVRQVLDDTHDDEIERSLWEVDHAARTFDAVDAAADAGDPYDVIHDHTGFAAIAMAERIATPLVHTLHGPFEPHVTPFYATHGHKAQLVAISESQRDEAPAALRDAIAVVHNPLAVDEWPFESRPGDAVLWIGRMSEVKGAHRAIAAARAAGVPLVLAGPVQPGQEGYFSREVEPHLGDPGVRYVGEIGGEEKQRAYADARAVLVPIRWSEPFGLVMVEAMACGTPVIAYPEGAARELVVEGETGFLVDDERQMAAAIGRLGEIDRERCRASVAERFDVSTVVPAYERVYEHAARREDLNPEGGSGCRRRRSSSAAWPQEVAEPPTYSPGGSPATGRRTGRRPTAGTW